MTGRRYNTEEFIKAIDGSNGIVSDVAERLGCNWWTAKRFIDRHPTVKAAFLAEREKISDLAENALVTAIKKGDTGTSKWWLTKMRRDDYGDVMKVDIDYTRLSDEDLDRIRGGEHPDAVVASKG